MKREGPSDSASAGRRTGLYGPYRPLILAVLFFSPILVFFLLLFAFVPSSSDRCAALEEIARDDAKVAHMRTWVEAKLGDPLFWQLDRGLNGLSNMGFNHQRLDEVGLDVEFLGISFVSAGVLVHRLDKDIVAAPENVEAVSLEVGRDAIIILTDRHDPDTTTDSAITSPTTKKIRDGVLVRCGFPGTS